VPLASSLLILLTPAALAPLVALDAVLVAVALLDLLAARPRVEVSRTFAAVQAVGRRFEVQLHLVNRSGGSVGLRCADDAPGRTDGLPAAAHLGPRSMADLAYGLVVDERGQHGFGDVTVRSRSPLGLWERQQSHPAPANVRVYPRFARARHRQTIGRLGEERIPVRARRRPGGENEFQRLRPYVAGDPYRHIDWKATARKRELVTREYGQESSQNLLLLLDCGRMMSARTGSLAAFDHALDAAMLLGQVALDRGDRVGLLAYDRSVRAWLPPRGGRSTVRRLIRATYDLRPGLEEPDHPLALRYLSERVRRRSLVVLLTAVQDEPTAELATTLVRALSSRHLAVAVWIRDTDLDRLVDGPAEGEAGPYVRGAAAELVAWRERALSALRRRGALVVDVSPEHLTPSLIHRYLEVKARRLL
jgi:uncharacterized protein (DUF58 family)